MSPSARRLVRVCSILALAPFLQGAHCNDDCGQPKVSRLSRPMEKTFYGPGFLVEDHGAPLAQALGSYETRGLKIDASKPVVVVLTSSGSWADIGRLDPKTLKAGDHGDSYLVVGALENPGKLPLFEGQAALDEAKRQGWDAVVILPRQPGSGPWEAAVAVEMGRKVTPVKDKQTGECVDPSAKMAAAPLFRMASLPVRCGDGVRQQEEECDDGNRRSGDGCNAFCKKER
jgi:cysteine-rich repeat protein